MRTVRSVISEARDLIAGAVSLSIEDGLDHIELLTSEVSYLVTVQAFEFGPVSDKTAIYLGVARSLVVDVKDMDRKEYERSAGRNYAAAMLLLDVAADN